MKRSVDLAAIGCVLAAVGVCAGLGCKPSSGNLVSFLGTTNIVFVQHLYDQPEKTFQVADPNELLHLVSFINLRAKPPCNCAPHDYAAVFHTRSGDVRVSFCDHCFDVIPSSALQADKVAFYRMPPQFYREFRELARTHPAEKWDVPAPNPP